MTIKNATKKHLKQITDITNYFILNTEYNFNFEPKTLQENEIWFDEHIKEDYPIIVLEEDEKVFGWASLSKFRNYRGYDKTTEVSLYIHNEYKGKSFGSILLKEIEILAKEKGFHSIVSAVASINVASINLHKKFGYEIKGVFEEIGYKNGKFLDVTFFYKILN